MAVNDFWARLNDRLSDQVWYQELRSKWEELDADARLYIRIGSLAAVGLFFVAVLSITGLNARRIRADFRAKTELVGSMMRAGDELREIKGTGLQLPDAKTVNWKDILTEVATAAGIDAAELEVSGEKPGKSSPNSKESLIDLHIGKTNIRQILKLAFSLENGSQPVKVRRLTIDTLNPEGYLEAKLSLSAFASAGP